MRGVASKHTPARAGGRPAAKGDGDRSICGAQQLRPGLLEARHVSFSYRGGIEVIGDFSMTVASDERVGISAPSGTGKTTLCQLLAGYLTQSEGEVLIDGAPLPVRGACPVQMICQHPEQALDPLVRIRASLADALGPGEALDEAYAPYLDPLGIDPAWLERYPLELSGGELQRCCIARALVRAPRFVIADEISTMLDAVTQAQIWRFLIAHCRERGMGMVVVTHSADLMDRIATRRVELPHVQRCGDASEEGCSPTCPIV